MKTSRIALLVLAAVPLAALIACGTDAVGVAPVINDTDLDGGGDADAMDRGRADSGGGQGTDSGVDAGPPPVSDSGVDSGLDGSTDSGTDSGTDADTDAGVDAGPQAFKVTGTVVNVVGAGLVLKQNGGDDLPIAAGATSFAFGTSVTAGQTYAVTIGTLPAGQACKVVSGAGTIGAADVTDVVIDCGNRTSCKTLLADIPGTVTGSYLIDVDGEANGGGIAPFAASCDMTFDDGQGGGAGGWTLIEATADGFGPQDLTEGVAAPGTPSYVPLATMQALATAATQVHLRTAGTPTDSATSVAETPPILNLRAGHIASLNAEAVPAPGASDFWTGTMAIPERLKVNGTTTALNWPNVYHAHSNSQGLHLVGTHSVWNWQSGDTTKNISMEVYVR